MLGALDCSQANVKVINACLEVDESLLELAVRQANHGPHVIELASALSAKALEPFADCTDALRDLVDFAAQRFELHARLANAPFDPFEPAVDLYESCFNLLESCFNLLESRINLLESSVDRFEAFAHLLASLVDLFASLVDPLREVSESSIEEVDQFLFVQVLSPVSGLTRHCGADSTSCH
jgi:hypothetical protein